MNPGAHASRTARSRQPSALPPSATSKPAARARPQGKWLLQLILNCPSFLPVKPVPTPEFAVVDGQCAGAEVCPLSQVRAGSVVCIKRLAAAPEVSDRLRELGLCEEQRIRLVARQSSYICQVCNARLAISDRLADSIMVEAPPGSLHEA
jgi:Fe2+ transport system protein FeoA